MRPQGQSPFLNRLDLLEILPRREEKGFDPFFNPELLELADRTYKSVTCRRDHHFIGNLFHIATQRTERQ